MHLQRDRVGNVYEFVNQTSSKARKLKQQDFTSFQAIRTKEFIEKVDSGVGDKYASLVINKTRFVPLLQDFVTEHNLTISNAAAEFYCTPRTMANWLAGDVKIPYVKAIHKSYIYKNLGSEAFAKKRNGELKGL